MRTLAFALLFSLVSACAHADEARPDGFVDAGATVPGLAVDMRYAGRENFVGRPIAGYAAPVCLLSRPAVDALAKAQAQLSPFGLGLKVFDCYRPARAVSDFARWARDPADQARKADYYPNVDKSRLFELGYIAEKSGHSRGSTVDLTIIDIRSRAELDMGSPYDLFDTRSWPSEPALATAPRANRLLLQTVMTSNGFRPLKEEWWHFTLRDEPYPQTYFDFPVTR